MVKCLKALQFATAVGVLMQMWLMYPGVMVLFASFAGLTYLMVAVFAVYDLRFFMWIAALTTLAVWWWTSTLVVLTSHHGFDYLSGTYISGHDTAILPYVFLLNALLSMSAIVLSSLCWRWLIFGAHRS